jgi:hypothetical protein
MTTYYMAQKITAKEVRIEKFSLFFKKNKRISFSSLFRRLLFT